MSLTREDMMSELELLPVWRLNVTSALPIDAPVAAPIQAEVDAEPKIELKVEEVLVDDLERVAPQETAMPDIANMDWDALKEHVIGSGDQNADWVFVGDVSTEGDVGVLLDKMLIAIQLQRGKNVYLTQLTELDFFSRQIALIQPKLIFAFGEKSAQNLLDSNEPLDALRGKVHQYQGVALVVSYPPSHLLHHTQDKAKAWADLCLARNTIETFN